MSVFVNAKVLLPEEDWRICRVCAGKGELIMSASEQLPFETRDVCSNPLCTDGMVKHKLMRVSQVANERATAAIMKARGYDE